MSHSIARHRRGNLSGHSSGIEGARLDRSKQVFSLLSPTMETDDRQPATQAGEAATEQLAKAEEKTSSRIIQYLIRWWGCLVR